jgi:2-keto-3-deoxy-L-rhamnonate aldolase RhmA
VGTGDLALSLQTGVGDTPHAQACASILRACNTAGVPCGVFTGALASALHHRTLGYGAVVVANDQDVVARGLASAR